MVTFNPEKRKTREYSLDAIHRLARRRCVFVTNKPLRDSQNLGHTMDSVCECLLGLEPRHYHESINYHNKQIWFDIYKLRWPAPTKNNQFDDLYIKLRLDRDISYITLTSFHLD